MIFYTSNFASLMYIRLIMTK